MVKAVFIDIDNTILDFHKSAEKAIEITFNELGFNYNESVLGIFHTINDALWESLERKEITKPELYDMRWKQIFGKLGISFDALEMEKIFKSTLSGIAIPVDHARDLLEYLYKKYPLYAATNSSYDHQKKRLTQSGFLQYFDDLFVSERIGAVKPEKKFFDVCFEKIGNTNPSEAVIIGDSITADILGGQNCGLKTIWFNPNNQETPDGITPDHTIGSLIEIKNIL